MTKRAPLLQQSAVFSIALGLGLAGVVACGASDKDDGGAAMVTISGLVTDRSGKVTAGTLVRLSTVDNLGVEAWSGLSTLSLADGSFEITVPMVLASGFVLAAHLPSGVLRAPALVDDLPVQIHPATESLVRVIVDITQGGASWSDLDASILRNGHDGVLEDLPGTFDLGDIEGLDVWVRQSVGDLLASGFLGSIAAVASANVFTDNVVTAGPDFSMLAPPPTGASCNLVSYPLVGDTFVFDIIDNGAVCDGNDGNQDDAFDVGFTLRIVGDTFTTGTDEFPAQTTTSTEDDVELVLGPEITTAGLEVTRKVYVTPDDDVARYLEIIRNPTNQPLTVSIDIGGDLGSDDTTLLLLSENGKPWVAIPDRLAATSDLDRSDATVGFVWDGRGQDAVDELYFPPAANDTFRYVWRDVVIAPGSVVVYAHFVLLSSIRQREFFQMRLAELLQRPPLWGLSAEEAFALQNFHTTSLANITGAAGSMAPGLNLTVENQTTGATVSIVAAIDGSFGALLAADAGESIFVRSETGGERFVSTSP